MTRDFKTFLERVGCVRSWADMVRLTPQLLGSLKKLLFSSGVWVKTLQILYVHIKQNKSTKISCNGPSRSSPILISMLITPNQQTLCIKTNTFNNGQLQNNTVHGAMSLTISRVINTETSKILLKSIKYPREQWLLLIRERHPSPSFFKKTNKQKTKSKKKKKKKKMKKVTIVHLAPFRFHFLYQIIEIS